MIIIEGPDGAGKSTLAEMLLKHQVVNLSLQSPKREYPEMHLYDSTTRYIQQYGSNHKVCVDRLIFSELCYGSILRGKCEFSPLQAVKLMADHFDNGGWVIFCLPDVNGLIFKRDEDPATIARIRDIHQQYFEWALVCRRIADFPARIIRYQWNNPQAFDSLKSHISRYNR